MQIKLVSKVNSAYATKFQDATQNPLHHTTLLTLIYKAFDSQYLPLINFLHKG